MNNKTTTIAKALVAALVGLTLCWTTLAAPRTAKMPQKAPMQQKAMRPAVTQKPVARPTAAHKPAPRPMPPVRQPAPAPRPTHCRDSHHDNNGWLTLGAAVIGGLVGGLIGG